MNLERRLARFEEVAAAVRYGLQGHPFLWPEWARKLHVPVAAQMGCTLVTATALAKLGHQLKRGARPVGRAYWGAPLKRHADLYVLEVQTTKNKKADRP